MNKKDILELKRRFKKTECTFTKLCGCFVNSEKEAVFNFRETFLNLPDVELFKYLDISKKVLSGGIDNNLLELEFPTDENYYNEKQDFLMRLKSSGLKEDVFLDELYDSIINNYDYGENYLILVFHDAYDVVVKTKDNLKVDESEEIYEYILCAICPVTMSKPGLGLFEEEQEIRARIRDWVVGMPMQGFVYPAFIDRSSDVNALMYYTKNAKEPHPELMKDALGCITKQTATIQKESFENMVRVGFQSEEDDHEEIFVEIQENLNNMIEDHKELYEGKDAEPITLSKEIMKDILIESDLDESIITNIEDSYDLVFGDQAPLAESLVDKKIIKANVQKKKEKALMERVEKLESRLEDVTNTNLHEGEVLPEEQDEEINEESFMINDEENIEDDNLKDYDVVLHVKPSKLSSIKTEIIDGQKCIVVPIDNDEQATINGLEDFV